MSPYFVIKAAAFHGVSALTQYSRQQGAVRRLIAMIACISGLCMSVQAHAVCSFMYGKFGTAAFNMGTLTMAPNAAVGTVIASRQYAYDSTAVGHQGLDCGDSLSTTMSFAMSGSGSGGTYATNIPGIGIQVYMWSSAAYYTTPTTPTLIPISWTYSYPAGPRSNYGTGYIQVMIKLVVTGPVDINGTNQLSYSVAPWGTVNGGGSQLTMANLLVTGTLPWPACTVTTPSVSAILPTVSASTLAPAGKAAGNTNFVIGLSCQAGTRVYVTLTDATNPGNTTSNLTLSPGSTASGVQLRVLRNGIPISFGPDSSSPGNTNQWLVGASASTTGIPLTAQYISTGKVVPGNVTGLATFTMSYQ